MVHKKVEFRGGVYWLHSSDWGGYLISPLDHYNEKGELIADPLEDLSYAIIIGETVMRYGKAVGSLSDLKDIK